MEPQRLNSCLLKTVSQPFRGFPKTTEECRLFQCRRFQGFIDFHLGSPHSSNCLPCPPAILYACFLLLFFFLSSFYKIPLSEADSGRQVGGSSPTVSPRRAGCPAILFCWEGGDGAEDSPPPIPCPTGAQVAEGPLGGQGGS